MRTVTAAFQAKLDLAGGAEPRILLEIDAVGGTLYYSDQTVTVDAQVYSSKVLEFGRLVSQIVPGEEVVRVASMNFRLSNIDPVDDLVVAGTEVRVYDWYEGLATVDKALRFKGNVSGKPAWDDREISFTANDIFEFFSKKFLQPLSSTTWPLADPDYYGWKIPILIGAGENLECIPIEAGAVSTLREDFNPRDTTIKLTSTTSPIAFPSSGTVIIGNEEHTYTNVSGNNLTGVPTHSDIIYPEGSNVLEKTDLKFIAGESFSDTPITELTELSILPFGSNKIAEKVAIDPAHYTINLSELIGGTYYATIVLTQIAAIRKAVSLAITQQPNQPITTQPSSSSLGHLHTITGITGLERHATSINSQQHCTNPTNAFDFNFNTAAHCQSPFISPGSHLKLNFSTTNLGTIQEVRAVIRSSVSSVGNPRVIVGSGQSFAIAQGLATRKFVTNITSWSQLATMQVIVDASSPIATFNAYEMYYEIDYTPTIGSTTVTVNTGGSVSNRIADVLIGGDTVADTLLGRLICSFKGYKDKSDGHYTGTAYALIEKPPDVIHFLWEKFSNGAVHADLDIAGTFLDARNNLPVSYKFGFALTWQVGLNTFSAQLAQMSYCRFFTSAGLAKFARIVDYKLPVKVIDTDDYSPLTEDAEKKIRVKRFGGAIEKIVNKVEIKFKHNPILGSKEDPNAYADNSESLDADAQSSIDRYGEQRKTWRMWAVRDDAMALDIQNKLLKRLQHPRTTTVFPSWSALSLMEPSDLITFISDKLRIDDRLSEILSIGNNSQVPKDFQPGEIILTVRDLGIISGVWETTNFITISEEDYQTYIESLLTTITATISVEDILTQIETLLMTINAAVSVTDIQTYLPETLSVTISSTISVVDTHAAADVYEYPPMTISSTISVVDVFVPLPDTPWCGEQAGKLYLQSSQFTSTIKDSEDVSGVDTVPSGISWDGTNTPWCGNEADKLYLQSGQFTSTIKDSEDVSGIDVVLMGISWDGTNTPWCGSGGNAKLYLQSGQFTSTLKTSEDVNGIELTCTGISWDGTNTPWCGSTDDKLYLQSGQFTSTVKTSEDVGGVDESSQDISWNGINTPWCGAGDQKLYLTSGQFSSTIKSSEYIGGVDNIPRGIETNAVNKRLGI